MQPDTTHSFLMPSRDTVLDLKWIRPPRSLRRRLRLALRQAIIGGPDPDSPGQRVGTAAFARAYRLLEQGDLGAAMEAYTTLGYEVTAHSMPVAAGER